MHITIYHVASINRAITLKIDTFSIYIIILKISLLSTTISKL